MINCFADSKASAFSLAFLRMSLGGHEVNPLHLRLRTSTPRIPVSLSFHVDRTRTDTFRDALLLVRANQPNVFEVLELQIDGTLLGLYGPFNDLRNSRLNSLASL
jgi:hypothetical protein